jgi:hypothetical protein
VEPYTLFVPSNVRTAEEFYTDSVERLAAVIAEVVAAEGPIHQDELTRRTAAAWGLARVGAKIAQRIGRCTSMCVNRKQIVQQGEFLWPKGMAEPSVRRRDDDSVRDIDLICPQEIALACRLALKAQFGMGRADLVAQAARLLGFGGAGQRVAARIEEVIASQMDAGRVVANGDGLLKAAPE